MPKIECNAYVDVWNCQAKIMLNKQTPLNEEKLSEQQREALEKLKYYVIYTENGGAINWSGIYPFSYFSLRLLEKILAGDVDVISQIEEPTDEDFRRKAEEMIKSLENDELVLVYDSALACGCSDWCQGYHQHEYITRKDEKYLLVDDGYGHHCTFLVGRENVASIGIILREIKVEDAIERLVSYLEKNKQEQALTMSQDFKGITATRKELREGGYFHQAKLIVLRNLWRQKKGLPSVEEEEAFARYGEQ